MDARVYPLCFTPKVYELWDKVNNSVPPTSRCASHCYDCQPSYQLRMKKQRRCEHPETTFTFDADGIHGVLL